MAFTLTLIAKLSSLLIMVLIGFVIVRIGLLRSEDSRVLSSLVIYVLQPCLIFRAFQIELSGSRLRGFFVVLVFSTAAYLVWILLTQLIKRPLRLDPIDQATLIYGNVGNLTLPLVSMLLGDEMVFYVGCLQLPFNIFFWTHGILVLCGKDGGSQLKRLFRNPNILAIILSVIILLLPIHVPDILSTTISSLADMVGPASMIVIGMVIAKSDLKYVFSQGRAYLITAGRQLIYPLLILLLLLASGFLRHYPQYAPVLQAIFLALSAPPASNVSQVAVLYDKKPLEASVYNTVGTLLCIFTLPITNLIFRLCFM